MDETYLHDPEPISYLKIGFAESLSDRHIANSCFEVMIPKGNNLIDTHWDPNISHAHLRRIVGYSNLGGCLQSSTIQEDSLVIQGVKHCRSTEFKLDTVLVLKGVDGVVLTSGTFF